MATEFTPGPWGTEDLLNGLFPSVTLGPRLSYPDGSGFHQAAVVINEGPTPEVSWQVAPSERHSPHAELMPASSAPHLTCMPPARRPY